MSSHSIEIGVDEAGRGALAGPVVAAAVVLPEHVSTSVPLITDSKQLTVDQREAAYQWITTHCAYGVGSVDALIVDSHGILGATEQAMQEAVEQCITCMNVETSQSGACRRDTASDTARSFFLLVDGRDKFWFNYPHTSIIKGDEKEQCIAAASIVAKVTRDRHMIELSTTYPLYNFAQHKGYGTQLHQSALKKHGPCDLHRHTFLRNIVPHAI